ncbi:MAG: fibronectin type III domain-containing protein [Alistipes sp.]|nr:fibronectin type III domain-containing protein [Alistipes sp.]
MRKLALFLILMMGCGFVACEKQGNEVLEPVYPSPEAVIVDDDACGGNSITLLFDGTAAIKAGAKSFTSNLLREGDTEPLTITKEAGEAGAFKHAHKNLPSGIYTASVYATYPDQATSELVFVTDSKGNVVKFNLAGSNLSVKLAYATSSTLAFTWSISGFKDAAKDCGTAYSFGIYRDEKCTDLVVSWQTAANDSIWSDLADGSPQFEFSGLDKNTTYWFVVEDLNKKVTSEPIDGKTLDFTIVEPSATAMVEAGGIALAEDFSELVWGANYMRGSAAYSADDRNLATAFDKAEGVNPINGGPWKWYLVDPTVEIGLFSTMKHAVENSRLATWGACNEVEGDTTSPICGRIGMLKLGASSKTALMCTPELNNLKSVATIEVQFDQSLYGSDPTTAAVFVINDSKHAGKAGIYSVTPAMENLVPAAEFKIKAGRTYTTEKIVLTNVHPGARIGIGPIRKDGSAPGSSQHRMFLDNVIVKVVAYEVTKTPLDKPVITSAVSTVDQIMVKWNSVEKATGYVLEYKEASAANYTVVELDKVLEYTISGLKSATDYQVRVKATEMESGSESEYSDVASVKTIVKASFPMTASTADEFIAILSDADALRSASATDQIQIKGNLDFTGKTMPAGPIFLGTLVGNGATISGVNSDHAIFATVGSVSDLTIDQSCTFSSTKAGLLAAIAGEAAGTFTNVVNNANVTIAIAGAGDATVAVGGLVAVGDVNMESCKNYGNVTYTATGASHGALVGGLAGYNNGAMNKCENHGKVTMSVETLSAFGVVKSIDNLPIHIGGLVAQAGTNAPMTECVNNGEVDYDITKIEKIEVSCGTNRPRMGGLVGLTQSSITSSVNNGKVDVNVVTSDGSVFSGKNYPVNIGGISGGAPSDATGATGADIVSCVNNGAINCVSFCKGTRPTCGGIVGYPGFEDPSQTNLVTRCENKGEMKVVSHDLMRAGGISGGSTNVTYCKNTGTIIGGITVEDGNIGGIIGWLDKGHKFEYNESYCTLSNDRGGSGGTSEIGGLIGQHGNYDSCPGEGRGCKVKCDITYDYSNEKWYGMILGYYWSTSNTVVLGTPDEPIIVLGGSMTYSGGTTQVTAENYTQYTNHSSAGGKSGSKPFTVHVKFGE